MQVCVSIWYLSLSLSLSVSDQVKHITGTTADIFLEYIQRNLPEGVDMSVYQEELDSLPAMLTGPPEGEEAVASEQPVSGKRNKTK